MKPSSSIASLCTHSACNTGDLGLIPGLGRSPGEGKGYPLQYSGLENSMDYTVHGHHRVGLWLSLPTPSPVSSISTLLLIYLWRHLSLWKAVDSFLYIFLYHQFKHRIFHCKLPWEKSPIQHCLKDAHLRLLVNMSGVRMLVTSNTT